MSITASLMNRFSKLTILQTELQKIPHIRTIFILKRKHPPPLSQVGHKPKRLKAKHYYYELVKDTTHDKQEPIDVILTEFVEKFGNKGDRLTVSPNRAYEKLLLPGSAVYATPENLEKYKDFVVEWGEKQHSSLEASNTIRILSQMILSVTMSSETPWTLKPWHVKTSFRKYGFQVPEECIEIPEQPIIGPNVEIENKEFLVTVTINNFEKVKVPCRIHHWDKHRNETVTKLNEFWKEPTQPIFPDDTQAEINEDKVKK